MIAVIVWVAGTSTGLVQTSSTVKLPSVVQLEYAEKIANERQPTIRQANASYEAADARTGEAFSALLPQVNLGATYTRQTGNFAATPGLLPSSATSGNGATACPPGTLLINGVCTAMCPAGMFVSGGICVNMCPMGTTASGNACVATPPSKFQTYNFFVFNGTVQQLIWDFGQTTGRWKAAEANAEAQAAAVRATKLQVVLNVRQAFFNARAQKDLVQVARDTRQNLKRHLDQIEGFVQVGTRPDIDLAQAKADLANADVQLINAENAYAISKAQLNQSMGIEGNLDYDVSNETFPPVDGEDSTIDPLVRDAVAARPEIAQIDQQLRGQESTISSVRGGYFPSISASTGVTDRGQSLDNLVWNWNAQLVLSWNIFQGFLTREAVREAEATYEALDSQLETLRLSIRLEVEQGYLAVRAAKAALVSSHEALVNAKERLRLAESRYETGVGNVIELGDAQVALTTAAGQEVSASYNLATARAQLLKALGRR